RRIAFASMLGEKDVALMPNLYWVQSDGSGGLQRLTTSPNGQTPGSWHPSGRVLAFIERGSLMLLPIEGDEKSGWKPGKPTVFLSGSFVVRAPVFSPDGGWLAYESNQSEQYNVYVRPFPGPGPQTKISAAGGMFPTWSRTRRELIYGGLDDRVMIVPYLVQGD